MPLYEYRCHSCGKTIEVLQKFSDEPLTVHEACGGELEKLISRSALQFKGTGWYVTDYAKGGAVPANGETKPAGESSGSESKPLESKSSEGAKSESKSSSDSTSKPAVESTSKPAVTPASSPAGTASK